ncbi:transposable element Tcb1 transposase [Trichonephila clavipes]|nr:transposable element Tcb1 transposase [Trichonephila clavipes]
MMDWDGLIFDHRTPLVHIDGCLTADRYVTQNVEPVVPALLQGAPNTVFQKDNSRPHVKRQTVKSLTEFAILSWSANSTDLNTIEHLGDLTGPDLNRGPLVQTLDEAWQRLPQATINRLIDRMPLRFEAYILPKTGTLDTE